MFVSRFVACERKQCLHGTIEAGDSGSISFARRLCGGSLGRRRAFRLTASIINDYHKDTQGLQRHGDTASALPQGVESSLGNDAAITRTHPKRYILGDDIDGWVVISRSGRSAKIIGMATR